MAGCFLPDSALVCAWNLNAGRIDLKQAAAHTDKPRIETEK
jgi:hypothetical protein